MCTIEDGEPVDCLECLDDKLLLRAINDTYPAHQC